MEKPRGVTEAAYAELFPSFITKSGAKKIRILQASIDTLARAGIQGFGYEALSKRTHLARAHIKYHFPSLDDLLLETLRLITHVAQQETVAQISSASTPRQQLEAVVRASFRWAEKYPEQVKAIASFLSVFIADKAIRRHYAEIRRTGALRIAALLVQIRPSRASKTNLAESVQGLITGNLFRWAAFESEFSLQEIEADTVKAVLLMVQAG